LQTGTADEPRPLRRPNAGPEPILPGMPTYGTQSPCGDALADGAATLGAARHPCGDARVWSQVQV